MNLNAEFRPRPIDIHAPLPIITEPGLALQIEQEAHSFHQVKQATNKRKLVQEESLGDFGTSSRNSAVNAFVPIPAFRIVDIDHRKDGHLMKMNIREKPLKRQKTSSSDQNNYILWEENINKQLNERIEYDLESDDEEFLDALNRNLETSNDSRNRKFSSVQSSNNLTNKYSNRKVPLSPVRLNENDFESLIDLFEREFNRAKFSLEQDALGLFQYYNSNIDDCIPCSICNDLEFEEDNQILYCDGCNLAVHQVCYGIRNVSKDSWLCKRCLMNLQEVECVFCASKEGAFKTMADDRWVHMICALWIPELSFGNSMTMEPIEGAERIPRKRFNAQCHICRKRIGVCLTCSEIDCPQRFHITCARASGFSVEMKTDLHGNVHFSQFCRAHSMKLELQKRSTIFGFKRLSAAQLSKLESIVKNSSRRLSIEKPILESVYLYWRRKRQRHVTPLLRRFQQLGPPRTISRDEISEHEYRSRFVRLRQDFDRLRTLIELVRKREILKRNYCKTIKELFEMQLLGLHLENERELPQSTKSLDSFGAVERTNNDLHRNEIISIAKKPTNDKSSLKLIHKPITRSSVLNGKSPR